MQFIAQDLSPYDASLPTGCDKSNSDANGFTPQDWTGNISLALSSVNTHFNILENKALEKHCGKR